MFVALGIQHAIRMLHSHLWPAPLYNIVSHYLINGMIFGVGGGKLLNVKRLFRFSVKFFV
jgi:hypothetical protein